MISGRGDCGVVLGFFCERWHFVAMKEEKSLLVGASLPGMLKGRGSNFAQRSCAAVQQRGQVMANIVGM